MGAGGRNNRRKKKVEVEAGGLEKSRYEWKYVTK